MAIQMSYTVKILIFWMSFHKTQFKNSRSLMKSFSISHSLMLWCKILITLNQSTSLMTSNMKEEIQRFRHNYLVFYYIRLHQELLDYIWLRLYGRWVVFSKSYFGTYPRHQKLSLSTTIFVIKSNLTSHVPYSLKATSIHLRSNFAFWSNDTSHTWC